MPKKKVSLLNRKRGTDPRRTGASYMESLQIAYRKRARKRDRAAFDAYHEDLCQRLFGHNG